MLLISRDDRRVMESAVSVLLVDDHPIARRGVETVLGASGEFEVWPSQPDEAALEHCLAERAAGWPDVLLLDLYLGVDEPCLALIARACAKTAVLVISASCRAADVMDSIAAGASGYLAKSAEPELLADAVRTVAHGGFALSAELADIMHAAARAGSAGSRRSAPEPPASAARPRGGRGKPAAEAVPRHRDGSATARQGTAELSPREEQALDLIASGFTHAQTATRMGVSVSTVDTYIDRIRSKLGVSGKAELVRAAIERGSPRCEP
jgi:DNA-binding NarL/FixJ family response regulator